MLSYGPAASPRVTYRAMNEPKDKKNKDDARGPDPVVEAIMTALRALEPGKSASPMDIARAFAEAHAKPGDPPDAWRRYMNAVKQQMVYLARGGKIEIIRKGQAVDPNNFKGVVRLRMPAGK